MKKQEAVSEALRSLKVAAVQSRIDPEVGHSNADDALLRLLRCLGCAEVVEEFEKVTRYYA